MKCSDAVMIAPLDLHRSCTLGFAKMPVCDAAYGTALPVYWYAARPLNSIAACTGSSHGAAQVVAGGAHGGLEVRQLVRRAVLQRRLIAREACHLQETATPL